MKRFATFGLLVLGLAVFPSACAVDVPKLMGTDAELRAGVMDAIASDSSMVTAMVGRLLGADGTRQAMLDVIFANGVAARQAMLMVAADPTRLDGVLSLAVQDPAMKEHVLTLLKGMEMAGAMPR